MKCNMKKVILYLLFCVVLIVVCVLVVAVIVFRVAECSVFTCVCTLVGV